MKELDNDDSALPYDVPKPVSADEAAETLFPTSPPTERPAEDDDGLPLYPPWVKRDQEDMPPLLDS